VTPAIAQAWRAGHCPGMACRQHRGSQRCRQEEQRDEGIGRTAGKVQQQAQDDGVDEQVRKDFAVARPVPHLESPLGGQIDRCKLGDDGRHRHDVERHPEPRHGQDEHDDLRQHLDAAQRDEAPQRVLGPRQ